MAHRDIRSLEPVKVISQKFKCLAPHHQPIPGVLFDMAEAEAGGVATDSRAQGGQGQNRFGALRGRTGTDGGRRNSRLNSRHICRELSWEAGVSHSAKIMCAGSDNKFGLKTVRMPGFSLAIPAAISETVLALRAGGCSHCGESHRGCLHTRSPGVIQPCS